MKSEPGSRVAGGFSTGRKVKGHGGADGPVKLPARLSDAIRTGARKNIALRGVAESEGEVRTDRRDRARDDAEPPTPEEAAKDSAR